MPPGPVALRWTFSMATHLSMSEDSRELSRMLDGVGGVLLETFEHRPLERITALSVLEEAERDSGPDPAMRSEEGKPGSASYAHGSSWSPAKFAGDTPPLPLQAYASDFSSDDDWRRLGTSVAAVRLSASDMKERAHLLWAKPGCRDCAPSSYRARGRVWC